jgi:hypothetical protein
MESLVISASTPHPMPHASRKSRPYDIDPAYRRDVVLAVALLSLGAVGLFLVIYSLAQ